jgi:hypothetical protein
MGRAFSSPRSMLGQWRRRAARYLQRHAFIRELQRLADATRGSPLEGRYWIVGGLLLGWAREGRPLGSDLFDADFAYLDEDHERFLATVPVLASAGFVPRHRFIANDGRHVEHRFRRHGIHFEFFRMTPVGDRWQYSMFDLGESPAELIAHVPAQPRVPFRFLGRDWLKVLDHDLALRSIYGDWHEDRPDWAFTRDCSIVKRIPIALFSIEWPWPNETARDLSKDHSAAGERPLSLGGLTTLLSFGSKRTD